VTAVPATGQTLAANLGRVTAAVAGTVRGLNADDARQLVTRAASRRGALRQLDRHLAAGPDALTSGSADAPLAVIALAGLLAGEGYHGVRVPCCAGCGAAGVLRHRIEGGRLCDTCDRRSRREPCAGCGQDRVVNKRTPQGTLCCSCAQPRGECAACGQVRRVAARRSDGAPLCKMCHLSPAQRCVTCGRARAVAAHTAAGPVCRACYAPPPRACGECGQQRPIARRATADQPDLCKRCAARPLDTCAVCGQQRRCSRRAAQPVCEDCRRAGHQPGPPARPGADPQAERARKTARARRVLPGRLTALLAEPGHGVLAQLEPLIAALVSTPAPSSVLDWVSRRSGAQLVADLAVRARGEPVRYQLLDTYPQTLALHHLRGLLVHAGLLPEREEYLDRIEPWLDQLLASCPPTPRSFARSPPGISCAGPACEPATRASLPAPRAGLAVISWSPRSSWPG